MRRFIFFSLLFWLIPTGALADSPIIALERELAQAADRAISEQRLAGAVVIIFHKGKPVSQNAYGMADLEKKKAMRLDSLFRLASVSKPIVAATALRMVERQELQLDAPVTKWLPDFRPSSPDGATPDITIHHLLTHTSGLSYRFAEDKDSPYDILGVSDGLDQPELSRDENLARLAKAPLRFSPGSEFFYSLATDVLGAAMAEAHRATLPETVDELLLKPLKMSNTGFQVTDPERLAVPYINTKQGLFPILDGTTFDRVSFTPSKHLKPLANPSGGAGMVGSAPDFIRFLECVRQGGQGLFSLDSVEKMRTNQLPEGMKGPGPGRGFSYLGSIVIDPKAAQTAQRIGALQWGGAYGHSWFIDPEAELSGVILTNTAFEGMIGTFPADVRAAAYRYYDSLGQ